MAGKTKNIAVYADWDALGGPLKLGVLRAHAGAGREVFEFEYEGSALANPQVLDFRLDPGVGPYMGRQFPGKQSENFGVFLDSSPDRWGRLLIKRRFERAQRKGSVPKNQRLTESDYLLGVHDLYRVGALRFRLNDEGPFLADSTDDTAPPFVRIRELEHASLALERDEGNESADADEWLRLLIAPGGSLGGARPKASVVDQDGQLCIAKFPSIRDEFDVGAWEMIVHSLARGCGIRVANARAQKFASNFHTYITQRFDRTPTGARLHFASAMTLTGRTDGDDASTGASYLELARVLIDHGAQTDVDLKELWTRIVFNICVSNTDDHLRNHGFILAPNRGWLLSEAFDMNPTPHGGGLKLNISEDDNAQDLGLALYVAKNFRVRNTFAHGIVDKVQETVRQWPVLASKLGLSAQEQAQMAPAFALAAD
jgi:serine/threonine-protein kinase HipA